MDKKTYNKLYRQKNKVKLALKRKIYYQKNKEEISRKRKISYKKNAKKIIYKVGVYYKKNKKKVADYIKEYWKKNRSKIMNKRKEYYKNNKSKICTYKNQWYYKRYHANINFRLTRILRSRLNKAMKSNTKPGSAVRDLGCTIEEFKIYIESKFQEGMTWENYGKYGWHIDHIQPISSFNLTDRKQLLQACHYTNLQPLWAKDNLRKWKNI